MLAESIGLLRSSLSTATTVEYDSSVITIPPNSVSEATFLQHKLTFPLPAGVTFVKTAETLYSDPPPTIFDFGDQFRVTRVYDGHTPTTHILTLKDMVGMLQNYFGTASRGPRGFAGAPGAEGPPGPTMTFRMQGGFLQWRPDNNPDASWTTVYDFTPQTALTTQAQTAATTATTAAQTATDAAADAVSAVTGAVKYNVNQPLTIPEMQRARLNIGAGTSDFSGSYPDLINKPTLGNAAGKNIGTTVGTVAAGDDPRFTSGSFATLSVSGALTAGSGTFGGSLVVTGGGTFGNSLSVHNDIYVSRGDDTGVIFFGNGNRYIQDSSTYFYISHAAYVAGVFTGASTIRAVGDIVYGYSDQRLKDNIKVIEDALDKVCQLDGVTWEQSDLARELGTVEQTRRKAGLLAQQLQRVLPEAIGLSPFDEAEDGTSRTGLNLLTIYYEQTAGLFVEAIKSLKKKNDLLEARLVKLEVALKNLGV